LPMNDIFAPLLSPFFAIFFFSFGDISDFLGFSLFFSLQELYSGRVDRFFYAIPIGSFYSSIAN